ncbi:uncharacterized protein LOC129750106 [Uranotaenia lowii]|uniref:uncharacterized protein LOC129750106 n=1 Tax=Uranotaenia lowii TaxID=190385 RepID=UPI00247860EA|nr:uncharacterized protein LOC129750106 [Uranotaenia lowii]
MVYGKVQYDLEVPASLRESSCEVEPKKGGSTYFVMAICFLSLVAGFGIGFIPFHRDSSKWTEEIVDSSTIRLTQTAESSAQFSRNNKNRDKELDLDDGFIRIDTWLPPMEVYSDSYSIVKLHLDPNGLTGVYGRDEDSLKEIEKDKF